MLPLWYPIIHQYESVLASIISGEPQHHTVGSLVREPRKEPWRKGPAAEPTVIPDAGKTLSPLLPETETIASR